MRPAFPLLSITATGLTWLLAATLASAPVQAQTPAPAPATPTAQAEPAEPAPTGAALERTPSRSAGDRHNQRIERIRFEDRNTEVQELRVGGETKNITVQPKGGLPAYEVQPAQPGKDAAQDGTNGRRTWKALQF